MESREIFEQLIDASQHMTLATADSAGKPWATPVFYNYDDEFSLYWVSSRHAVHSENIRVNPQIAISIYGPISSDEPHRLLGIYIDAVASEISDEPELTAAIEIMQQRAQPSKFMITSAADVTGDASWRIYKAVSQKIYRRQDGVDEASGQIISIREDVPLTR